MASIREHLSRQRLRRKRSRGPSNAKIAILVVVFAALLVTGVALYWKGQSLRVSVDPATLCPTDGPPAELLVILLDMSDAYTEAQQLQIRNELARIQKNVSKFGRIEVYSVDRIGERVTKPQIQLCNPGSDRDVNRVYENPRMARRKWQEFSQRLEGELTRLMTTDESATSPIFEAIQSTALQTFDLPQYDDLPRRLVVVSDLLQHMPGRLSQYQDTVSFRQFEQSKYFSDIRADLTAADVTLLYLVRPGTPQKPEHLVFWESYFDKQGAQVTDVVPIYGAH